MALSTVSGILARIGLGKLGRLGLEPAQRYERARPGELIHIDVKKLGRIHQGAGKRVTGVRRNPHRTDTDAAHVARGSAGNTCTSAIDDATRLAYVEVLARREGDHRRRVPSPRRCTLRRLRHHHRASDHRQRRRPTAQRFTRSRAAHSASATSAPGPTDPRPTAKPNDSSAPCSAAGPTARSTATATNATPPSPAGWTSTIAADHTAPSATSHR